MKKALSTILFLSLCSLTAWGGASPVAAEEKTPDFSDCTALRDEKAYGDEYEDYQYLLQGKDGWFFRSKQDLRTEFKTDKESMALFIRLVSSLKDKGTDLVIAFPPPRGMAASAFLPNASDPLMNGYSAEVARNNYKEFIRLMNDAGIHIAGVPDIKTKDGFFYKTDMHWTTAGAKETALAVAEVVRSLPGYAALRKTEFVTSPAKAGTSDGHYNEALKALCGKKAPAEKAEQEQTKPKESGHDNAALFQDQPAPEVILVGTSNSNREDFDLNFSGSLKQALSTDILNTAIAGGGVDDSMLAYLSSASYKKNPAKLIIWEIPGYYNLSGEMFEAALRQIIPAVYGDCDAPLAESGSLSMEGKAVNLLENLEGQQGLIPGKFYLSLSFDKPALKKLKVTFADANGKKENFKFSASRNPDNKSFFYMPSGKMTLPSSVSLEVSKEIKGYKGKAKLCAIP